MYDSIRHMEVALTFDGLDSTGSEQRLREFGKRVLELMNKRGWNQSELARRSSLPRDSVSRYITGKNNPSPANLQKLADALGVQPETLLPASAPEDAQPGFQVTEIPGDSQNVLLRVNKKVSYETLFKLMPILRSDGRGQLEHSGPKREGSVFD